MYTNSLCSYLRQTRKPRKAVKYYLTFLSVARRMHSTREIQIELVNGCGGQVRGDQIFTRNPRHSIGRKANTIYII